MSLIPFSTLSMLFPCKIRSNFIAHIQMIYCVKLSHLLWCLNSREWLKIQVVCSARLPNRGFMLRAVFEPQLWKLHSGIVPTDYPWAEQETVVWHSWTTAGLSHSSFPNVVHCRYHHCRYHHHFSWNSFTSHEVLHGCHKVFDISPFWW